MAGGGGGRPCPPNSAPGIDADRRRSGLAPRSLGGEATSLREIVGPELARCRWFRRSRTATTKVAPYLPRRHPRFALLALLGFVFLAPLIRAESVRWDPPGGTLAEGQRSQLDLVFEDCAPAADFELPAVSDLSFSPPSQRSETSIINFKMSRSVTLSYPVFPTRRTTIEIPSFEVATDHGKQRVPAAKFEVADATVGSSGVSIDRVAGSQLTTEPATVWAGEVFDLRYRLLIARRYNPTNVGELNWTAPAGLMLDAWTKPELIEQNVNGEPRVGVATHAHGYARNAGTIDLPPARQLIDLQTGQQGWSLLSRAATEQFLVTSKLATLLVKPLPLPAPAGFLKAVGQFTFESKVVPEKATVGEPITWTLSLAGAGNWPDGLALPPREVSRDFQTIRPQIQRTPKEGTLFEGSLNEDVVLIPTKPGNYTLGSVTYAYFDPKAGEYKTVRTHAETVKIEAAVANPFGGATGPAGGTPAFHFTPETAETPSVKSPAPTLPGRLPLDPLAGLAEARPPWESLAPWLLLTPLGPLALLWILLGVRRARQTDPRRPQREAQRDLGAALAAFRSADTPAARATALREWQRLTARLWGTGSATPTPAVLLQSIAREARGKGTDPAEWERLWNEADAFLYARAPNLPENWLPRAETAAKGVRLTRRPVFAGLRLTNLWPAAVALVLAFGTPEAKAASAAEEAYNRGEFTVAEQAWRTGLSEHPSDWKTRHNLGLALAQQNHWSEAAAHWSAAFLAAPRDPKVRWELALGLTKAEFTQPELSTLAAGEGLAGFTRMASPAEWQIAIVAGALLVGLGLAGVLVDRHAGRRIWRLVLAAVCVFGGLAVIASGYFALRLYGPLARPDAVLVWHATELRSIPTEAGEQKTEPLVAGTLARGEKSFLGWDKLTFANGQTGWVRHDNLVYLYR